MNYFKYIVFFFLLAFNSIGQENLILNGDFEEYWECPDDWTQIEKCRYVYNPCEATPSTSDYYNDCDFNSNGDQNPRSGLGMVGFLSLDELNFHYREYVQVSLVNSLECGNKYRFSAFFSLSDLYRFTLTNIGFFFTKNEIDTNVFLYQYATPQYTETLVLPDDTSDWVEISFDFVADDGYEFLTIGHFLDDGISSYIEINPNAISQAFNTYLYIDDASLIELESTQLDFPNVFTPDGDSINDVFHPLSGIELIDKLFILNLWGDIIQELDYPFEWDGLSANQAMVNEGVYYYSALLKKNCSTEKEHYHGVVHLIR